MELNELIQELAKLDLATVVKALHEGAQPIYQAVFDKGHSVATERWETKVQAAEEAKKAAEKRATTAEAKVTELEAKTPDVAKVRSDYEAELKRVQSEAATQVATMKGSVTAERLARGTADLKALLVGLGLDRDYAGMKAEQAQGRFRFTETGSLEVLKAGTEIPLQAADGKSPLDLLAKELYDAADAKWKASNGDRGSGTGGGGGGGQLTSVDQIAQRKAASGEYAL